MRLIRGVRRPISLKPCGCTERGWVDAAGISVKVICSYPGISAVLLYANGDSSCHDGTAEVSRGHSRFTDRTEGPNM